MELNDFELKYIRERGFELIEGKPKLNQLFPYFTATSGLIYHLANSTVTKPSEFMYPLINSVEELVSIIEHIVAGSFGWEGHSFKTKPGQKIKIFMMDPAWRETVETLIAKYQ